MNTSKLTSADILSEHNLKRDDTQRNRKNVLQRQLKTYEPNFKLLHPTPCFKMNRVLSAN